MSGVSLPAAGHPLHDLAERLPAVLFVAEDGRPVYVSQAATALLGRAPEEYVADPVAWDRDRASLHEVGTSVVEDGVRRTYGALVAADPALDPITLLPARGLLLEHVRAAVARARPADRSVAVLHAGLDGLDLVAAGLGRAAHEEVVREVAGRVRAAMPEQAIVASLGDGELAVLLADVQGDPSSLVETAAGQLIVAAGRPLRVEGEEFELVARVGASVLPGDAADEHALLRHAETAMRTARRGDGVRVLFYDGGTADALERLLITGRLRRAVERGELLLHFQPIFRLPEGDVVAVEALLRWRDPERGLVPPLDFIPVAEYTGMIEPIGRWVVEACCAQAARWRAAGLEVPVSFNVSPRQFRDPSFVETLEQEVARHGIPASQLIVEVTESVAMREPQCVEPVLERLRFLGTRLAIDDFGAGYSSLARLRDLEVDLLKIDRTFLAEAATDERAGRIVGAALDLARALDMTAVAEGVETEQQRRFLVERGCALAQGFHLARPLPTDEATALLAGPADAPRAARAPRGA
ncbi:MAG TPA: GGDEF domain-containing phosphodiesterase [Solirubrobacteraceae bacterium]|nr:GGDEF domain-containing phosphodiesterase [Solirubrobacteraceae bacterium]